LGNNNAIGSGTLIWAGGTLSTDGTSAITLANPIRLSGGYTAGSNPLILSGTVDLEGAQEPLYGMGGDLVTFANTISNGGLTLIGGYWSLTGNNSFTGGITLANSAIVIAGSDSNLGGAGGSFFFEGGIFEPSTSFTLSHPITSNGYGATINTNGQTLGLTSPISASLTITGDGYVQFRTGGNSGSVNVESGVLELLNTGTTDRFGVTVMNGARFAGIGSAGQTFLETGATLAPGTTNPGNLTFNGSLELGAGSFLDFRLGLSSSDELMVDQGSVDEWSGEPNGPILINISDVGGLAANQVYTLIDWSNGGSATISASDFELESSPIGGNFSIGEDHLIFTTVPEPSSVLSLGAIAMLCLFGRRKIPRF
jgi:hypothetical protein